MKGVMLTRMLVVSSLVAGGLVASTAPARAAFHFMKVQEVFAGGTTQPSSDYVELVMTESGQNFVTNHTLHLYNAAGTRMDCRAPADAPFGNMGDPILFATTEAQTQFVPADFTIPPLLDGAGGAVCWENIDCVSWGSFGGQTTSPAGTPFPGGIPPGSSIHRSTDTDNSATDFAIGAPSPFSNGASNLGATPCAAPVPGGGGKPSVQNLKAKVKGNRAIISGKVQPPSPGQRVKLTFFANGSPLRKVAKKSDTLNGQSKFKKSFRVPSDSTRCRVRVAFKGAPVGKKTFRC